MTSASAHCSFCHKSAARAGRLVVPAKNRDGAAICEECVNACINILAEDSRFPEHPIEVRVETPSVPDERRMQCSFCLRLQDAVEKLISSPEDYERRSICNTCVNGFSQKLRGSKEQDENRSSTHPLARWIKRLLNLAPAETVIIE
jgi:ATP-dependent protease Clp ATPase subunit